MHKPTIGGSRRNPVPEESTFKPSKSIVKEPVHAVPAPPDAHADAPAEKEKRTYTEAEVMALYYAHRGSCPLCGKVMKKGITGHLSKCLPSYNSEIRSRTS